MTRLSHATAPAHLIVGTSAPALPEPPGIVHLGLGNFHRAHAAVYTAKAMAAEGGSWGIEGWAFSSDRLTAPLTEQDGVYSLVQLSARGTEVQLIDVHRGFGVARAEAERFVASIADPSRRILTLTISEKGYCLDPLTGTLDTDHPDIAHDIALATRRAAGEDADEFAPRSAMGLVASALTARARTGAPFTVLSCDNVQGNGERTRAAILGFLTAAGAPAEVHDYVRASVAFPNSMVDRIVPGTTADTAQIAREATGLEDAAPVRSEEFTMWVLEDHFPAGRPAWDEVGAIMTDEVDRYELVKLRLLNGSHSLMSYLGALAGAPTIPAAFATPEIREAVLALIERDYLPTIELPTGFDAAAYVADLEERWSNVLLGDSVSRVGSDGSAKLVQRVPEAAHARYLAGSDPALLALLVAAWIACVAPPQSPDAEGFEPGALADAMEEPLRDRLRELTADAGSIQEHARAVMAGGIFPDLLTDHAEFTNAVAHDLEMIVHHGAQSAARQALGN